MIQSSMTLEDPEAEEASQARWRAALDLVVEKYGGQREAAVELGISQPRVSQLKNRQRINGDVKIAIVRALGYVPEDLRSDPDVDAIRVALSAPAPMKQRARYGQHPELLDAAKQRLPQADEAVWNKVAAMEYDTVASITADIIVVVAQNVMWNRSAFGLPPPPRVETGAHRAKGA